MKMINAIAGTALLCFAGNIFAQSVTIQYGTVASLTTVKKEAQHAGGAVAGGLLGAMIGPRYHRGLRTVVGAGIGAAAQGAATSGMLQQYTVNLVNGGTSIVSTEQTEIRLGDCVSVEQGSYDNIRRVSDAHCESKTTSPPTHHILAADECETAKDLLVKADTDEEITNAAKKVRILCED